MSRRLVSYEDIALPPAPLAASTSTGGGEESGPSVSHHQAVSSSRGQGRKKRENQYPYFQQDQTNKRHQLGNQASNSYHNTSLVHWDDPSYTPERSREIQSRFDPSETSPYSSKTSYPQQNEDGDEDEDERNEEREVEDLFDETNPTILHFNQTNTTDDGGEVRNGYSDWKYDEEGELYTSRNRSYSRHDDEAEEGEEDYDEENDPQEYDEGWNPEDDGKNGFEYDDDEEPWEGEDGEEVLSLSFMIPDVEEFHKAYERKHSTGAKLLTALTATSSLSTNSFQTRPPDSVGGGGRNLTHSEIWGPSSLKDAHRAALDQFYRMHSLDHTLVSRSTAVVENNTDQKVAEIEKDVQQQNKAAEKGNVISPLWNDAPAHDSLLAQQIRQDTNQILQNRKLQSRIKSKGATPASLTLESSNKDTGTGTAGAAGGEQSDGNRTSSISKNHQSNGLGGVVNGDHNGGDKGGNGLVTHVPCGHLPGNQAWKKAVRTVQRTPNSVGVVTAVKPVKAPPNSGSRDTATQTQSETLQVNSGEKQQEVLNSYWWAGYRAGFEEGQRRPPPPEGEDPRRGPHEEGKQVNNHLDDAETETSSKAKDAEIGTYLS